MSSQSMFTPKSPSDTPSSLCRLPNELLIIIANESAPSTLVKLMTTCKHLFLICAPIVREKAIADPHYSIAALFWAAVTGDREFALKILSNTASIDVVKVIESYEYTPNSLRLDRFILLPRNPIEDLVTFVLNQRANLCLRPSSKPLYISSIDWAAKQNHMGLLSLVLEEGINVDDRNYLGQTPLHTALRNGNEDMARYLLIEFSAEVNAVDRRSRTPLIFALRNRKISHEVLALLLRLGADPHHKLSWGENSGWRPLHIAASINNEAAVRLLLNYGADPNAVGTRGTPLHLAAARRDGGDIVKLLLGANSSLATRNGNNATPFELAELSGNPAAGELLCALWNSGVSSPLPGGRTFTHLAARHSQGKLLAKLLEKKRDIETEDNIGQRPIHAAATSLCSAAVTALAAAGAELDCFDKAGRSPLHIAATVPGLAVYSALLKLGSRCALERDLGGRTAVHIAAWTAEYPECVCGDMKGELDGHLRRAMAKRVEDRERTLLKEVCDARAGLGGYLLGGY